MDFELDDDQEALTRAVRTLLDRRAGAARARELLAVGGYDIELEQELDRAGFLDILDTEGGGPLAAVLVVEAVASALGTAAVGTRALVLPASGLAALPGPVALLDAAHGGLTRYAPHARTALVLDGDQVTEVRLDVAPVAEASPYGYPLGRIDQRDGRRVDAEAGVLRNWWRVAIAAEIAGVLSAAVFLTRDYVNDRHQFGRPLGAFQAVQHKLAESLVLVEGTRWLARSAAWHGAETQAATAAATYAAQAATRVPAHLHQVSGAMGFTSEHDLTLYTMRALALRVELGGVGAHASALARARWS